MGVLHIVNLSRRWRTARGLSIACVRRAPGSSPEDVASAIESRGLGHGTSRTDQLGVAGPAFLRQALASVPSLTDGDLPYFRRVAAHILESQPGWISISLASADGKARISVPEAPNSNICQSSS